MTKKDVHTEHCCLDHGCKYGKYDVCTVSKGEKEQSFPCEECYGILPKERTIHELKVAVTNAFQHLGTAVTARIVNEMVLSYAPQI